MCSGVCLPPSEQQQGGRFVWWGQLEEATDPADISDADGPALRVHVFGSVQFFKEPHVGRDQETSAVTVTKKVRLLLSMLLKRRFCH